jgi:hypothetical protein
MHMFRTRGLIFRKTAVTRTGTVQNMSTGTVQPGSSKCGWSALHDYITMYGTHTAQLHGHIKLMYN